MDQSVACKKDRFYKIEPDERIVYEDTMVPGSYDQGKKSHVRCHKACGYYYRDDGCQST